MFEKDGVSRRSFVKQSLVATGVAGGVLGNVQTVAADKPQTLTIEGTGDYIAVVNDPNASGRNLEGDSIRSDGNDTTLNGTVDGDKDILDFDGWVTFLRLDGDLEANVSGTNDAPSGDIVVSGSDSSYAFVMTYSAEKTGDCEDASVENGDTVNGYLDYSDEDTYSVIGAIKSAVTFSADDTVEFTYQD